MKTVIKNVNIVQPVRALPVARAYDFFDRLNKKYDDWKRMRELFMKLMEKY